MRQAIGLWHVQIQPCRWLTWRCRKWQLGESMIILEGVLLGLPPTLICHWSYTLVTTALQKRSVRRSMLADLSFLSFSRYRGVRDAFRGSSACSIMAMKALYEGNCCILAGTQWTRNGMCLTSKRCKAVGYAKALPAESCVLPTRMSCFAYPSED